MDKKLTLKLNEDIIAKSKVYAARHDQSLSRLIESYLKLLVDTTHVADEKEIEITAFVKSMTTGESLPSDVNYKEEYGHYITDKYQ